MDVLPTGTVTFLFTDLEGSTRRWEAQPEAMRGALARHDVLLRETISMHGGSVFKTVGDAFYAAFAVAQDALLAAIAAQRRLLAEDWSAVGGLSVRMALHTGSAEVRDGDYFGPPLNRVARLLSAGHGGQVLLSNVTQELVRDGLSPDVSLRDLGEHQLKDLYRPEHVFQLVAPGLPGDFSPLKTLDQRPNNLPIQPTPLIGREQEVRQVLDLLQRENVRLVTLTGPGGTGKTRLGLQAAAELVGMFPDGVWFVPLAHVVEPAFVIPAIATTLTVQETPGQSAESSLVEYLQAKQLLLLLDNLEQVIAVAPQFSALLRQCPKIEIIATSRLPLRLQGEFEYPVPPLGLPDTSRLPDLPHLTQFEAVRLFIQRAQAVKADFEVTNENAPAVAAICVRLDGLPLAIELAAARTRMLAPDAMLQRLERRLPLLTGGARDLPARQQTLRNAIAWSYDLLTEDERKLYRRLSVFAGGWTLEAAEAVAGSPASGEIDLDVLDGLERLMEHNLVRQGEDPEGTPRFSMLATIREYGFEQLEASGEAHEAHERHVGFILALTERARPELRGNDQMLWLDRLNAEAENLRVALRWAIEHDPETAANIVWASERFWQIQASWLESRLWANQVLVVVGGASIRAQVIARMVAASMASSQLDHAVAEELLMQCLPLLEQLDDSILLARVLNDLGWTAGELNNIAQARKYYMKSLRLFEENNLEHQVAMVHGNLGLCIHSAGDYEQAVTHFERCIEIYQRFGDGFNLATARVNLAYSLLAQHEIRRANALFRLALIPLHAAGDVQVEAECLEGLAGVAAHEDPVRAGRLFGAADALRVSAGTPRELSREPDYERFLEAGRAQLDEDTWQAAWDQGAALTLDEAVAEALGDATVSPM